MNRLTFALMATVMMTACSNSRTTNLGVRGGGLSPCPNSPNCVVSSEKDPKHHIEPIVYACDQTVAFTVLKDILNSLEHTTIVEETPLYFRLECRTKVFKFVDDVEFYFSGDSTILMRSASRVGFSDLGVNRRRLEKIRIRFNEKVKSVDPIDTSREEYIKNTDG